ncbi:MAG TPA: type II toxin-antitoxin system HicB family antitoxin, partial [Plasticicumulans sp.]|nr:type II toxin-antitoxin system HicB family antitoxin [Plasticicumulans sp.]
MSTVYWREVDRVYIAEVPELPGCMADGASQEEAVANARQVIEYWIATAKELGHAAPEPRG